MSKSVLIDIDTQNDFMRGDGALYVPGAELIIPALETIVLEAIKSGTKIISTIDCHDTNDDEFKAFPPHCIKDTIGANKIKCTRPYNDIYCTNVYYGQSVPVPNHFIDYSAHLILHKKTYDIWDDKLGNPIALDSTLKHIAPNNIFLCGVATDVCVLAAAKGLFTWFNSNGSKPALWIITDAIKGLKEEESALKAMIEMGFNPILSEKVKM